MIISGKNSLNELLWKGDLINGLNVLHLIRIRMFRFLITFDLKKAFLQIEIDLFLHQFLKFFSVSGSNLQNAFKQKLVWHLNATLQHRDDDHHIGYKKVSDGHQHVVVALFFVLLFFVVIILWSILFYVKSYYYYYYYNLDIILYY